jgi:hypothetical protein
MIINNYNNFIFNYNFQIKIYKYFNIIDIKIYKNQLLMWLTIKKQSKFLNILANFLLMSVGRMITLSIAIKNLIDLKYRTTKF